MSNRPSLVNVEPQYLKTSNVASSAADHDRTLFFVYFHAVFIIVEGNSYIFCKSQIADRSVSHKQSGVELAEGFSHEVLEEYV